MGYNMNLYVVKEKVEKTPKCKGIMIGKQPDENGYEYHLRFEDLN